MNRWQPLTWKMDSDSIYVYRVLDGDSNNVLHYIVKCGNYQLSKSKLSMDNNRPLLKENIDFWLDWEKDHQFSSLEEACKAAEEWVAFHPTGI